MGDSRFKLRILSLRETHKDKLTNVVWCCMLEMQGSGYRNGFAGYRYPFLSHAKPRMHALAFELKHNWRCVVWIPTPFMLSLQYVPLESCCHKIICQWFLLLLYRLSYNTIGDVWYQYPDQFIHSLQYLPLESCCHKENMLIVLASSLIGFIKHISW